MHESSTMPHRAFRGETDDRHPGPNLGDASPREGAGASLARTPGSTSLADRWPAFTFVWTRGREQQASRIDAAIPRRVHGRRSVTRPPFGRTDPCS